MEDTHIAVKYVNKIQQAKDRNIEFKLSFSEFKRLFKINKCYYTKKELNRDPNSPLRWTLERIDNTKGYIKGNCVACCFDINNKKDRLTIDELFQIVQGIKRKKCNDTRRKK